MRGLRLSRTRVKFAIALTTPIVLTNAIETQPVQALSLVNPGFDAVGLPPNNGFLTGNTPGWEVSGNAGILNPNASQFLPVGEDYADENVAFSNGGRLLQRLDCGLNPIGSLDPNQNCTLLPNTSYTLTVDVGRRLIFTGDPGYKIEFLAGDEVLADLTSPLPEVGTFLAGDLAPTLTFATGDIGSSLLLGEILGIQLSAQRSQINFDNVRLTAQSTLPPIPTPTPTPEPTPSPTLEPTPSPSPEPTPTPTPEPTLTPTPEPTVSPTFTPTPLPTNTQPLPSPSPTSSPGPEEPEEPVSVPEPSAVLAMLTLVAMGLNLFNRRQSSDD
jgi:hypothetical protein